MKSFILSLMIGSSLFGYEVSMEKEFEKKIIPDILSVNIKISTTKKNLEQVITRLGEFSNNLKNVEGVTLKDRSFTTSTLHKYKNNKPIKIGYVGYKSYQIVSKNEKKLQTFLQQIQADEKSDIDFSFSSGSWQIDKKQKEKIKEQISIEAIKWAKKYAKNLSKTVDDRCKLETIILTENRKNDIVPVTFKAMKNYPLPKKEEQTVSIFSYFKYRCK